MSILSLTVKVFLNLHILHELLVGRSLICNKLNILAIAFKHLLAILTVPGMRTKTKKQLMQSSAATESQILLEKPKRVLTLCVNSNLVPFLTPERMSFAGDFGKVVENEAEV